jgi:nicotinate-nucleotide adenylyltransferase
MSGAATVAVFGGSFNPPHVAHVLAAALALATEGVDRVVAVPTFQHPFAKALAPYDDRVLMSELAMGWMPQVEVSRVEEELGGESKTLRTLEHLQSLHPAWRMRLLIGSDLLGETPKWWRFDAIEKIAPPIVLGRVGHERPGLPAVLPAISSTDVRAMVKRSEWDTLGKLVPRAVLDHVRAKGLYT